jgi:hypothetical protein
VHMSRRILLDRSDSGSGPMPRYISVVSMRRDSQLQEEMERDSLRISYHATTLMLSFALDAPRGSWFESCESSAIWWHSHLTETTMRRNAKRHRQQWLAWRSLEVRRVCFTTRHHLEQVTDDLEPARTWSLPAHGCNM